MSGVVERDVQLIETGTSQAVTVQSILEESGQAAATYYAELRNSGSGTLRGVYSVVWEEVQPKSPVLY